MRFLRYQPDRYGMDYMLAGAFGQAVGSIVYFSTLYVNQPLVQTLSVLALVLGTGVTAAGCSMYAQRRGRSRWWGLMGIFGIFGLLAVCSIGLPPEFDSGPRGGFEVIHVNAHRRNIWKIDVRVLVDESLDTGVNEPINLQLPRGANIKAAVTALSGPLPGLKRGPGILQFRVNTNPATEEQELHNGDGLVITVNG